jgi:hypothetical protein
MEQGRLLKESEEENIGVALKPRALDTGLVAGLKVS